MLNNLSNFFNIITGKMIKKVPENSDLIPLGTRDIRYGGGYKPTAITVEDFANAITLPPAYKVYTALLTQSGGDNAISLNAITGTIIVGVTYQITGDSPNCDFTNIGASNNNPGTYFVATNTVPNSWGDLGDTEWVITGNAGAPVVTVLENTIGNIWFTYNNIGVYNINSDNLFKFKFAPFISGLEGAVAVGGGSPLGGGTGIYKETESLLYFFVTDNSNSPQNNLLYGYPIEIRVYN